MAKIGKRLREDASLRAIFSGDVRNEAGERSSVVSISRIMLNEPHQLSFAKPKSAVINALPDVPIVAVS